MADIQTELLFDMYYEVDQGAIQQVGMTSHGTRLIGYFKGGTFAGPRLKGDVLPGGATGSSSVLMGYGSRIAGSPSARTDGHLILHGLPRDLPHCARAAATPYTRGIGRSLGVLLAEHPSL